MKGYMDERMKERTNKQQKKPTQKKKTVGPKMKCSSRVCGVLVVPLITFTGGGLRFVKLALGCSSAIGETLSTILIFIF